MRLVKEIEWIFNNEGRMMINEMYVEIITRNSLLVNVEMGLETQIQQ